MDNLENNKVISSNPFSPSSKISENDLLNSGFTQVPSDMPILGKKVKNVIEILPPMYLDWNMDSHWTDMQSERVGKNQY